MWASEIWEKQEAPKPREELGCNMKAGQAIIAKNLEVDTDGYQLFKPNLERGSPNLLETLQDAPASVS